MRSRSWPTLWISPNTWTGRVASTAAATRGSWMWPWLLLGGPRYINTNIFLFTEYSQLGDAPGWANHRSGPSRQEEDLGDDQQHPEVRNLHHPDLPLHGGVRGSLWQTCNHGQGELPVSWRTSAHKVGRYLTFSIFIFFIIFTQVQVWKRISNHCQIGGKFQQIRWASKQTEGIGDLQVQWLQCYWWTPWLHPLPRVQPRHLLARALQQHGERQGGVLLCPGLLCGRDNAWADIPGVCQGKWSPREYWDSSVFCVKNWRKLFRGMAHDDMNNTIFLHNTMQCNNLLWLSWMN